MKLYVSIVLTLCLCLLPAFGFAQRTAQARAQISAQQTADEAAQARALARQRFAEGTEAFRQRRFQEAADLFMQGFTASHNPMFLSNAARALFAAGDLDGACDRYNQILALPESDVDADTHNDARVAAAQLREVIARRTVPATTPTTPATTVTHTAPAVTPPTPPTPRTRVEYVRPFPYMPVVMWGLGAVALGFSLWSVGVAVDARNQSANIPHTEDQYLLLSGRADNATTGAIVLGVVSAAFVGAGAVWYALLGPGERRETALPPVAFAPLASGGGMAVLQGTF